MVRRDSCSEGGGGEDEEGGGEGEGWGEVKPCEGRRGTPVTPTPHTTSTGDNTFKSYTG